MKLANEWKDYKILDMADGQKLERWGEVIKFSEEMERNKCNIPQK